MVDAHVSGTCAARLGGSSPPFRIHSVFALNCLLCMSFGAILSENLVFLDETGIWLNFTRMYDRSKRGQRCHAKRPKQKGEIVTLIGAMALSGVISSLMYEGGTTQESFLFFIQTVLH